MNALRYSFPIAYPRAARNFIFNTGSDTPKIVFQQASISPWHRFAIAGTGTSGATESIPVPDYAYYDRVALYRWYESFNQIMQSGTGTPRIVTRAQIIDYMRRATELLQWVATLMGCKALYDMDWTPICGEKPREIELLGEHLKLNDVEFEVTYSHLIQRAMKIRLPRNQVDTTYHFFSPFTMMGGGSVVHMNMFTDTRGGTWKFLSSTSALAIATELNTQLTYFEDATSYYYPTILSYVKNLLPWVPVVDVCNFRGDDIQLTLGRMNSGVEMQNPASSILTYAGKAVFVGYLDATGIQLPLGQRTKGLDFFTDGTILSSDPARQIYAPAEMELNIGDCVFIPADMAYAAPAADSTYTTFNHGLVNYDSFATIDNDTVAPYIVAIDNVQLYYDASATVNEATQAFLTTLNLPSKGTVSKVITAAIGDSLVNAQEYILNATRDSTENKIIPAFIDMMSQLDLMRETVELTEQSSVSTRNRSVDELRNQNSGRAPRGKR